jgi:hypothetical protein
LDAEHLPPPRKTNCELIGAGDIFAVGPSTNATQTEVMVRMVFLHDDMRAAKIFVGETLSVGCNGSPGSNATGGPPVLMPTHRLFMFLLSRDRLTPRVTFEDKTIELPESANPPPGPDRPKPTPDATRASGDASVPLIALAWARSGDKGNLYNVGIIAREAEYLPYIRTALTEENVAQWLRHTFDDPQNCRINRYDVPGINALNFVVHEALLGGASTMLRLDSFAKGMGQQLLLIPIPVPQSIARRWDGSRLLPG